jgi:hypothetical protein
MTDLRRVCSVLHQMAIYGMLERTRKSDQNVTETANHQFEVMTRHPRKSYLRLQVCRY